MLTRAQKSCWMAYVQKAGDPGDQTLPIFLGRKVDSANFLLFGCMLDGFENFMGSKRFFVANTEGLQPEERILNGPAVSRNVPIK